jgi:hypothetical protein
MAHGAQVVQLVRLDRTHQVVEAHLVGQIAVVQVHPRVATEMVDTTAPHHRALTHQSMHFVSLAEQELGEIGAILTRDTCDQNALHGGGHYLTSGSSIRSRRRRRSGSWSMRARDVWYLCSFPDQDPVVSVKQQPKEWGVT